MKLKGKYVTLLTCALVASLVLPASAQVQALGRPLQCDAARAGADPTAQVRCVVDTYFTLRYQSQLVGHGLDLGGVIDQASEEGTALLRDQTGRLRYFAMCWQDTGTTLAGFDYQPVYDDISISGETAVVHVRPLVGLRYTWAPKEEKLSYDDPHTIRLALRAAGWRIVADEYANEETLMFPAGTDFAALQATYHQRIAEARRRDAEFDRQNGDRLSEADINAMTGSYTGYDGARAASYGKTYTNNDGGCTTTGYNTNFVNYASGCVDCQNFVSQCIWYGFGGVNDYSHIHLRALPMVDDDLYPSAAGWWNDGSYSTQTWRVVSTFYDMIKANHDGDRAGVQGFEGSLAYTVKGDFLWWKDASGVWSHSMIVTDWIDRNGNARADYNELYYSGHTNNRKNVQLSQYIADSTRVRYFFICMFKNPS